MSTPSIGFQSEYIINHLHCDVVEHRDYSVLSTPTSPDYYFGNLLALKIPLSTYSRSQWRQHFRAAFNHSRVIKHETYVWQRRDTQSDDERISEFVADNFEFEETHILTQARSVFRSPQVLNQEVSIRPLQSKQDWQQWTEYGVADLQGQHIESNVRSYLKSRVDNYLALAKAGCGQYLGAFDGERLVGYAGLYQLNGLARFQNVLVAEDYRRQGIAQTLLTRLIEQTAANVHTLCIHADENYHATELYQRLGFKVTERECALCWWPDKPVTG